MSQQEQAIHLLLKHLAYTRQGCSPRSVQRQSTMVQACYDLFPYFRGERNRDERFQRLLARLPGSVSERIL